MEEENCIVIFNNIKKKQNSKARGMTDKNGTEH